MKAPEGDARFTDGSVFQDGRKVKNGIGYTEACAGL